MQRNDAVVRFLQVALMLMCIGGVHAAERVTYFVSDALGSPVAAMDEQGEVVWREGYAPYGERNTGAPESPAQPAYTGKPDDKETGFVYMGARMYDPEAGRFSGIDPQGFKTTNPQTFNRYLYANNSPYVYSDPDGEASVNNAARYLPAAGGVALADGPILPIGDMFAVGILLYGVFSDSGPEIPEAPSPLPGGLVGEQGKGSRVQGDRHNSGPLSGDHGGTGNAETDFGNLTGGNSSSAPEGARLPEGAKVGENGIIYRPGTESSGPRIDIPANGDKPHETLHYPKPLL